MKKIEASAIYYALFLSVIFALILGGLILFSGFNQNFAMQMDVEEILIDNSKSGIAYGQANFRELEVNQPVNIRLFGQGVDSVEITRKQWGAYTVISSKAVHRNRAHLKIALMGDLSQKKLPNLYLSDFGKPLSLCGTARIEGNCFISESGLKRAYIEGKNYQGSKMVYGTVSPSTRDLPEIKESFVEELMSYKGAFKEWENEDSINVSFAEEGVHYVDDGYLTIDEVNITGQVFLEARDSVFVSKNAVIENAIIKSPVVHIESGFSGTVQVFASEKIVLEENVQLKYPSVLGLIEHDYPKEKNAEVKIGSFSQVIGTVFLISEQPNFRKLPLLTINPEAELDGLVYCQGKTQLKGIIKGHLYSEKMYLKTAASSYENHLLDGQILDELPEGFITANLFEDSKLLTRMSWLN